MSLRYRCGRLTAACALALFADGAQAATNYYWTGAADSAWANVANWQTDGASGRVAATMPPGVITNGTGEVVYDNPEGCAVFGPVADGAPTKIDVSGTKEVKYIRFAGATAPSYELGIDATSAGARLGVSAAAYVWVDADVVNDQAIKAPILFPAVATRGMNLTNESTVATLTFTLIDLANNPGDPCMRIYGCGRISYQGDILGGWGPVFYFYQSGIFESTKNTYVKIWRSMEYASGGSLRRFYCPATGGNCFGGANGGGWNQRWGVSENTLIEGPGYFYPSRSDGGTGTWNGYKALGSIGIKSGKKTEVRSILKTPSGYGLRLIEVDGKTTGGGTLELCATNFIYGALFIEGGSTLRAAKFGPKFSGNEWETSYLGRHEDILIGLGSGTQQGGNGTLEYSGAGETGFDSTFTLAGAYEGCLRNAGTGSLGFCGAVTSCVAGASFRFEAETAPIDFTGTFGGDIPVGLTVSGASKTIVHARPNVSSVILDGGTLAVAEGVSACTLPTNTVLPGVSAIEVPAGTALTIDALDVTTGGRLNISAADGATVTVAEHGGTCPAGVFLNGIIAQWDENGVLSQNVTMWKTATDGAWSVADNWSAGVPVAGRQAHLAAEGGSYTVTANGADMNDRIFVTNGTADATTTLAVNGAWTNTDAIVDLRAGAVLSVTNGFCISNTATGAGTFTVGKGARLEFVGGEIRLPDGDFVTEDGSEVEYLEDALLVMDGFTFGSGTTRFTGTGAFSNRTSSGTINVRAGAAGETALLDINPDETRLMPHTASPQVRIYSLEAGGTGILNLRGAKKNTWDSRFKCSGITVGWRQGLGVLNCDTIPFETSNSGFSVAAWEPLTWSTSGYDGPYHVTGIVNAAGSNLQPGSWNPTFSGLVRGLLVGDAGYVPEASRFDGSTYRGTVNLASGTMSVGVGSFVLGFCNQAEGEFIQTGGQFSDNAVNVENATYGTFTLSAAIGLFGGTGRYVISNGVATVRPPLYVGGALPLDMGCYGSLSQSIYSTDQHDARGLLSVCGGTFTAAEHDVIVGADGAGVIELGAAWRDAKDAVVTGSLLVKNLVLSNQTASTLRFTLSNDGAAFLNVTNRLTITDGAQLVVDARAVSGHIRAYTKLADVHAFDGAFSEENVTLLAPTDNPNFPAKDSEIVFENDGEKGIWLKRGRTGFFIIFR